MSYDPEDFDPPDELRSWRWTCPGCGASAVSRAPLLCRQCGWAPPPEDAEDRESGEAERNVDRILEGS